LPPADVSRRSWAPRPYLTRPAAIALGTLPTLLLVVPVWRLMVRGLTAGAAR